MDIRKIDDIRLSVQKRKLAEAKPEATKREKRLSSVANTVGGVMLVMSLLLAGGLLIAGYRAWSAQERVTNVATLIGEFRAADATRQAAVEALKQASRARDLPAEDRHKLRDNIESAEQAERRAAQRLGDEEALGWETTRALEVNDATAVPDFLIDEMNETRANAAGAANWFALFLGLSMLSFGVGLVPAALRYQRRRYPTARQLCRVQVGDKAVLREAKLLLTRQHRAMLKPFVDKFRAAKRLERDVRTSLRIAKEQASAAASRPTLQAMANKQVTHYAELTERASCQCRQARQVYDEKREQLTRLRQMHLSQIHLALLAERHGDAVAELSLPENSPQLRVDTSSLSVEAAAAASAIGNEDTIETQIELAVMAEVTDKR